jgi:hypothetical protein
MTDFPRHTCANCDTMTELVQAQAEEIKKLREQLKEMSKVIDVAKHSASMAGQIWEHGQLLLCDALVAYDDYQEGK